MTAPTPPPEPTPASEPEPTPVPASEPASESAPVPAPPPTPAERTAAAIGPWATAEEAFALLTVNVPAEHWIEALTTARDTLGLTYFDWLSAVDELADGFSVAVHLAAVGTPDPAAPGTVRRVLFRTRIPRNAASLPTATGLFAGAGWHERETHEMFGIDFPGHPHLATLLLPDGFEGHPLRKEFVLAARVAKAWPGAKEPGESDHAPAEGAPAARRRMLPPGVPDPNEWGPLAGTLPPVPERPARGAVRPPRAAAAGAATPVEPPAVRADRPRRNRSVDQGSASQAPDPAAPDSDATPGAVTPGTAVDPAAPAAPPPPAPSPEAPWQLPPQAPPPSPSGEDA